MSIQAKGGGEGEHGQDVLLYSLHGLLREAYMDGVDLVGDDRPQEHVFVIGTRIRQPLDPLGSEHQNDKQHRISTDLDQLPLTRFRLRREGNEVAAVFLGDLDEVIVDPWRSDGGGHSLG